MKRFAIFTVLVAAITMAACTVGSSKEDKGAQDSTATEKVDTSAVVDTTATEK
jgi:hypothetical protein